MPIKIAILASGSGSNAENIINYFSNRPNFQIPVILSNKSEAFVHQRAKNLKIPSFTFTKDEFEQGFPILDFLDSYQIDFIVLAGFLLKVSKVLIENFLHKIINIHPALLPAYGGKGMYGNRVHEAVSNAGETESGITIHYVNENYDEGSIIFQLKCQLLPTDTPESIARKVHALEYEYFPKIIEKTCLNLLK